MRISAPLLTAGVAAVLLAGCSSSGSSPASPTRVCNIGSNVLQMNVGTANLFGTAGLNVAVTYRQSASANCYAGNSGALVSTPTLSLPHALAGPAGTADTFNSTIVTGPAPAEIGTVSMTATPQTPNATTVTTFGNDGGAFGLGLEPFNYVAPIGNAGVTGKPASVFPYPVPLYDPLGGPASLGGGNPNGFIPGGGPPAFSVAGNVAATDGGFNGVSEGLDVFSIAPSTGAYSLSVLVPANTGAVTQTATATLSSAALLAAFTTPVPTVTAAGGVTLPVTLPAGVTEAYIQLTDFGPTATGAISCNTTGPTLATPVYYTVVLTASGTATFPAGTICTAPQNTTANKGAASDGDAFSVQAIGFDYPAYEASYPNSLGNPSPTIVSAGATHQSDLTISPQTVYNIAAGNTAAVGVLPTSTARHSAFAVHR